MTDKTAEFVRINEPRVNRAQQQLNLVRKSAASMRIDDDTLNQLLGEFGRPAGERLTETPVEIPLTPRPEPIRTTLEPGLHSTRAALERMTVRQLTDLLTMTAAQIDIKLNQ